MAWTMDHLDDVPRVVCHACSAEALQLPCHLQAGPGRPHGIRPERGVMSTLVPLACFRRWVVGEGPWSTRQSLTGARPGTQGVRTRPRTLALRASDNQAARDSLPHATLEGTKSLALGEVCTTGVSSINVLPTRPQKPTRLAFHSSRYAGRCDRL